MLITYDLETTNIAEGTPELLYLTAYGETMRLSIKIDGKKDNKLNLYKDILEQHFLTTENNGAQFVAWNANRFDSYFTARALLESDRWILQPYLTASKALRGLRVKEKRTDAMPSKYKPLQFEFLDGIAMTGITAPLDDKENPDGTITKGFLSTFAPAYRKLKSPNFEDKEEFDCNNKDHIKYAERDSEGLYHGMKKVEHIIKELTGLELKPTVGNLAIRYFMTHLPADKSIKPPTGDLLRILHGPVKRGGYCWASEQYHGPAWKYDINQAYAAAMRDAKLPAGQAVHTNTYEQGKPGVYIAVISRKKITKIPFYYKDEKGGKFTSGKKARCWITSIEADHLLADGWSVIVETGFYWTDDFNMSPLVDKLETLRSTDKDGPSGPLGTMVKALGNNAYGKTLEQLWGNEFVFAKERPEGYDLFDTFDPEASFIFARIRKTFAKKYHLPQIGIFITAHVRCVVRATAMIQEGTFLYADTDCIAFSKPAPHIDIHPTRYGSWKRESDGDEYIIIGKKAYWSKDGAKAKGLVIKGLTKDDYILWKLGKIPVQVQLQRQNLLKYLAGRAMFAPLERKGTNVSLSKTVKVLYGQFYPA